MKKIALFAGLMAHVMSVSAQLFMVTESSMKDANPLDLSKKPIVDINGQLTIAIDFNRLTARLGQQSDHKAASDLELLTHLLRSEKQLLEVLAPITLGAAVDKAQLTLFQKLMGNFLSEVIKHPDLREKVNSYYGEAIAAGNKLDRTKYPTIQSYVVKKVSEDMGTLANKLNSSQDLSSVSIQLMAFLTTTIESDRRIHIENFDTYAAGDFYEVPRWVTTFSDDDKKAFDQVGQLSQQLNKLVDNNSSNLSKLLPQALSSLDCFSKLSVNIKDQAAAGVITGSDEIKTFLNDLNTKVNAVYTSMQTTVEQGNGNALSAFNNAEGQLIALAEALPNDVNALKAKLSADGQQKTAVIYQEVQVCLTDLQADVVMLKNIYNIMAGTLQPFRASAEAAAQVGNAISFSIKSLPNNGYINLKNSGRRENGDQILIKLVTQSSADKQAGRPAQTIDYGFITLQQIQFYSESTVGAILAFPLNRSSQVTLPGKSQFAPSGNLLFKFGSRKSHAWNAISPGIGFNISTPDFNLDGSPDIGYGGVITLFRNTFSSGISYDAKTYNFYWFVGLSLPLTSIGLPIGNVSTEKMK